MVLLSETSAGVVEHKCTGRKRVEERDDLLDDDPFPLSLLYRIWSHWPRSGRRGIIYRPPLTDIADGVFIHNSRGAAFIRRAL
jgi:hypothetical protein